MSTYYLDTSAVLKRVIAEPESPALRLMLRTIWDAGELLTSSTIAWVETWRALRRTGVRGVDAIANAALSGVAEFALSDGLLERARRVGEDHLRSLDAIHLAAAIDIGAEVMVTYDQRLGAAAESVGITVAAPA